ncbi:MAG TPA: CoA-binding protein [Spirochaetota bacterium]|nr:CoA-binding protein [Spirochaetota bacterium]HPG49647.1 CoA-binding protein [Spirochaetota bacterium]HPN10941.1 CoA-binding protein [Spirochaetota bacterium]
MGQEQSDRLNNFFSPRNIAVIGASTKNHWFANIVSNARRIGFPGAFYPVNPGASEVCGIPALASVNDLPEGIDFAAVIVRSAMVADTVQSLAARGIKNILLVSSGFSETGDEGTRLQNELVDICRARGVTLLGPNCLGFLNPVDRTGAFSGGSIECDPVPGNIGIIGQSGASSEVIATKMLKKGLGISLFVSSGNEAVVSVEDCIEHMVLHGRTRVIAGFIEGFRDVRRLARIAREAAHRSIPIVLIKVGRSEKGMQAARSHTGAMAGNEAVTDAFLRQHGIIRADTIEELVETAGILSRCPLPAGGRLAVCTLSGGLCGLYADLCGSLGIELHDFTPATIAALKEALPPFAQPGNPLDVTGSGFTSGMDRVLGIMLADENTDLVATLSFSPEGGAGSIFEKFNEYILGALPSAKPIIPIAFREVGEQARRFYRDKNLYVVEHTRDGFKAIANLIAYAKFRRKIEVEEKGRAL